MRVFVSRKPALIVTIWLAIATAVGCLSPNLTRLAAEGQAKMLASDAESRRAAELVNQSWPDSAYESMAVAALYREGGLSAQDEQFARRLSERFLAPQHPKEIVRVLGPASPPEIASRLTSADHTVQLLAVSLSTSFVAPISQDVVAWLERQAHSADLAMPAGLELRWTGDAVIGRDYMANVQTSLDRAAIATIVLLLIVLLAVYRSFWLAAGAPGDDRHQPGDRSRNSGLDDPGGMGNLAAGRAVPDRDLVRHRH